MSIHTHTQRHRRYKRRLSYVHADRIYICKNVLCAEMYTYTFLFSMIIYMYLHAIPLLYVCYSQVNRHISSIAFPVLFFHTPFIATVHGNINHKYLQ